MRRVQLAGNGAGAVWVAAAEAMARQERTISFALERANLLQEQIQSLQNERMNRAILRLGVVATVFLPLGFITGLLGINVAGIPGSHNSEAFWQVCGLLLALALVAGGVVARIHRTRLLRFRPSCETAWRSEKGSWSR